eukprot:CAMPEP_0206229282 /NCGR_PEP_ID=MMETSP0047_2-20121206/9614_1 /ASSEMBLY_ACC=CAM_ASM_000192 /TAXON_ID=195065 /ORGANISM="Chroomonas mesostigmatica_cf, Strain CCMP1168" /LENGTH=394 /DNA_ID=CAMNT_0053652571 /DNA_START=75 /DNA_END=1260 /DNA_ORIENTATION=+
MAPPPLAAASRAFIHSPSAWFPPLKSAHSHHHKIRSKQAIDGRRGQHVGGAVLRRALDHPAGGSWAAAAASMALAGQGERARVSDDPIAPVIAFPGGGIYFWWQAGAVKSLQKHYNLTAATLMGASAGALTAALAGCEADMDKAFAVAQRLAKENNLWARRGGLMGIWGPIIREWLEEVLPKDAAERCSGRLHVSVAEVKPRLKVLERCLINSFDNRSEFIEACLTSVHIPYFLDGKPFREYRGRKCVDGSVTSMLRGKSWHVKPDETVPTIFIDHKEDKILQEKNWGFLETISESSFKEMYDMGYEHLEMLHEQGKLIELDDKMRLIALADDQGERGDEGSSCYYYTRKRRQDAAHRPGRRVRVSAVMRGALVTTIPGKDDKMRLIALADESG